MPANATKGAPTLAAPTRNRPPRDRREYYCVWIARIRAEGRCKRCGDFIAEQGTLRDTCVPCAEKRRAHDRQKDAESAAAALARKTHLPPPAPSARCGHCRSRRTKRAGTVGGRQRYRCHECGRTSYGVQPAPLPAPPAPCPYCGARCRKNGRRSVAEKKIVQLYRCTACHRENTELQARDQRRPRGRRITLCLDPAAVNALILYCNRHLLSAQRAIRRILGEYAYPPVVVAGRSVRRAGGERVVVLTKSEPIREPLRFWNVRLPDLRSADMTARRRRQVEEDLLRLPRTALVDARVRISLDPLAWEGLVRVAMDTGRTHQQVARELIARARP